MKAKPGNATAKQPFPIVAIGASAGGMAALERFLSALPADFGFALIFMQHLSPDHKSLLPDLLRSRTSGIDIVEVTDRLRPLPGKLYLCPPAQEVTMVEGLLRVHTRSPDHLHLPIDELFVSLAEDVPERTIAVILSGAGTDGARGVQAVRSGGGTVFVQDPATAEFPSMPLAAINTGQMDGVLSPEEAAREIVKFHGAGVVSAPSESFVSSEQFERFFRVIMEKSGYRFDHYKRTVVARRIRRRMYLSGIASVDDYVDLLGKKEEETAALASDLMIGVTSFFRDRLAWKALHLDATRKLAAREEDGPIRVWCAACATGEEAYSVAMMLRAELDRAGKKREINVFATDVNERALERAREGMYSASIAADVPAEYLQECFTGSEDGMTFTISKEIRQHVVFAKQDLLTDPPFSRIDLLICRNLLIYLEPEAQEKCIALLHYALKDGGYLFLGNAESPGRKSALFSALPHKKCRIYQKVETKVPQRMPLTIPFVAERPAVALKQARAESLTQSVQEALLEAYAPAAVAINQNHEILYHSGPTNRYLRHPRGIATQNLLDLVPENVRNRIRGGLFRATQESKPVVIRANIADERERKRQVSIRISKVREHLFLIVFKERSLPEEPEVISLETAAIEETAVRQLEYELSSTRENIQSYIEQLKSLNEEMQSSNEELQAANEELETSREELQSLNEELVTVNAQLQTKVEEEERTNNDLANFLTSTSIPTIFLDTRFRVKRFTPAMSRLIKLIPADVGRPIIHMSQEHLGPDLITDAQSVLDALSPVKREFRTNGTWYLRSTLPYRTADNRIEGVVVTYNDVTERMHNEQEMQRLLGTVQEEKDRLSALVDSISDEVWFADPEKRFTLVNPAALREFGPGSASEMDVEKLAASLEVYRPDGSPRPVEEAPPLRALAGEVVKSQEEIIRTPASGELRHRQVSAAPVRDASGNIIGSVSVVRDITEHKRAEEALRESEERYRSLFENLLDAYCYCKMIFDEGGHPVDFIYLEANSAFEVMSGFANVVGKKVTEVIPGVLAAHPEMFETYGRVALTGRPEKFEIHFTPTGRWFSVSAYSARKGYVAILFENITERKRTEEALRESETRFRLALRHAPVTVAVQDRDLRYLWAYNQRTARPEDIIGKLDADIFTPEEAARLEVIKRRVLEENIELREQMWFDRPSGRVFLDVYWEPIRDQAGRVIGVGSATVDLTPMKLAEDSLRESEEKYRALFDTMDEFMAIDELLYDDRGNPVDWRILDVNPAYLRGSRRSRDQIVGRRLSEIYGDRAPELSLGRFAHVVETGEPVQFEQYFEPLQIYMLVSAFHLGDNRFATISSDITERKRMEEELRTSRDELGLRVEERTIELRQANVYNRSLLETSLDPLVTIDPSGKISDVNAATERVTGYPRERLIGTDFSDYFTDPERARAGYAQAFAKGWVRDYRLEIHHRDGRVTPVLYNASVYRDEGGRILGVFAAARDITGLLKLEEQLRQAHKLEAIGTLAGGIAHDFNNILAAMIGFSELAMDEVPDDAKALHHLKRIFKAGLRGRELVKQILAFSRKTEGERKAVSLTSLVKETHALLRSSLPSTIQMSLVISTNDDYVLADPAQIQQVLMNLATNAAYAMREGGGILTIELSSTIFLAGSPLPDPELEPGAYVRLTVKDTGTGMTEEVRRRIFEPFFTTKEQGKGTGMGLAVVYGVVKGHGGAVTVQSEVGQGSTFEVFLPQVQKPEAKKEEAVARELPTGTERVLFVDDEELLVEMGRAMLESLGYQVTVTQRPTDAWNLFLENPSRFDIIITDQTMPDMTGVTLARKMLKVRDDLPTILCTGYSETASAETAKEAGISAFVMKPVVKKELAETIRRVLDGETR
jgi:two-component system, chemotaxis family, CheB/CheR fusion protein